MNAAASAILGTPYTHETMAPADTACFHCGLPVDASTTFGVLWNGRHQPMCCVGCEAVASMIIDNGLDDFYRHRTGYSTKPMDAVPALSSPRIGPVIADNAQAAPVVLYLTNLTCAACVWLAENTLRRVAGMHDVQVNFTTHSVRLRADRAGTEICIGALRRVGLHAERADDAGRDDSRLRSRRKQLIYLGVAGLSMMQVMMLTVPLYFASADDISIDARHLMGWAAWLMTLPALLFSARPIFVAAWRGLSVAHVGMDLPVAIALLLTFLASSWSLLAQQGHLYFDAITMFVFLLLGARWIESTTRDRAVARIERMANPRPVIVSRLIDFPRREASERVDSKALEKGEIIAIEQGAVIPADGMILRGDSEVDEALMTGESKPVPKNVGDTVVGGTVNMTGSLVVRVTAVGKQSVLAQLARLVDSGLLARPAFHGMTEKVARYLAPGTVLLALCGALVWLVLDPAKSLDVAVAVLVITCPCAFALAAPTASAAALGAMAERGLLVVRGHVLETLATATDVVFDKTGTITTGDWQLVEIRCVTGEPDSCLAICGALESGAIHPVARAVQREVSARTNCNQADGTNSATPQMVATTLSHAPGAGVEGMIGGEYYRFGTMTFALGDEQATMIDAGLDNKTLALLSVKRAGHWTHLATLVFDDAVRPNAVNTIAALEADGLDVHMLSGDRTDVVNAVASACGLDAGRVRASQSAADKRDYILALQAQGRRVVAIGDGMNDAPMLAAADAGIGLASGASLTRLSSDAVLDEGKQQLFICIGDAFARAGKTLVITRQNLGWAFAYNAVALPLAFCALVTPFIAAVGMAASSLVVVINASRLWSWNRSGS